MHPACLFRVRRLISDLLAARSCGRELVEWSGILSGLRDIWGDGGIRTHGPLACKAGVLPLNYTVFPMPYAFRCFVYLL